MTQIDPNPGLPCPECSHRIKISIQMLLSGEPIACPSCQLVMSVDKDASRGVLDALVQLDEKISQADDVKKTYGRR